MIVKVRPQKHQQYLSKALGMCEASQYIAKRRMQANSNAWDPEFVLLKLSCSIVCQSEGLAKLEG